MLQVLSPEEVIESREKFLDDLEEALLGDPAEWDGDFPDNFDIYNALLRIFELWKNGKEIQIKLEATLKKSCECL